MIEVLKEIMEKCGFLLFLEKKKRYYGIKGLKFSMKLCTQGQHNAQLKLTKYIIITLLFGLQSIQVL